jgi:hypothetical protein
VINNFKSNPTSRSSAAPSSRHTISIAELPAAQPGAQAVVTGDLNVI